MTIKAGVKTHKSLGSVDGRERWVFRPGKFVITRSGKESEPEDRWGRRFGSTHKITRGGSERFSAVGPWSIKIFYKNRAELGKASACNEGPI